jgi:hypothetical protein
VVEESVREMSALDEAERLAWPVLQTVNRTQARGSTVRIIVPSDEHLSAEDYLLVRGYVAPVDIGLTRGTYTITSPEDKGGRSAESPVAEREDLRRRLELAESRLREERDRLVRELERDQRMKLEGVFGR